MNSKRKIQLADFNRTVILATANTLFLNHGIEGTTMDEIAHEVGFSKTTLYTYFDSKQDIVDHLIRWNGALSPGGGENSQPAAPLPRVLS